MTVNNFMLNMFPGQQFVIPAIDGNRDVSTNWQKSNSQTKNNKTQATSE